MDKAAWAVRTCQAVHEHARGARRDTRAVVQGYRRTSLGAARRGHVLAAGGIDGQLDRGAEYAVGDIREPGRHLLGPVVWEATTQRQPAGSRLVVLERVAKITSPVAVSMAANRLVIPLRE